jgi:reductive dehalogenase
VTHLRKEWVYTNYSHPYTPYPYGKPVDDMEYPYIICLAMRQNPAVVRHGDRYVFCIEAGWRYSLTSLVSITLANLIRSLGFRARALPPENSPYMVPPTFIDAGMGEQGRMGICITKEFGNNFRPAGIATNMPLVVDKPVEFGLQDLCDKCKVCADACPSGAITRGDRIVRRGVRRWQVDDQKCRSYWNHLGFPCAICQAACPYNFPGTTWHNTNRNLIESMKLYRKPASGVTNFFMRKKSGTPALNGRTIPLIKARKAPDKLHAFYQDGICLCCFGGGENKEPISKIETWSEVKAVAKRTAEYRTRNIEYRREKTS